MTTSSTASGASIQSKSDYEKTPSGRYKYWSEELGSSLKAREKWWRQADRIVNRYLGEQNQSISARQNNGGFNLNLFHSNTKTLGDMLWQHP